MLNSLDHGETTTPAVPRDGRPELIATDLDVICRRHAAGVDFRKLPAGTKVLVDTSNSRYRFVKLEGHASRALAQGGRCADRSAAVRIEGSTMGGSVLRIGWIGLGLSLEVSIHGKRLETSPVRSIVIVNQEREDVRVLTRRG